MLLSTKEHAFLQDQDFLLTKAVISKKLQQLLFDQQARLKQLFDQEASTSLLSSLDFSPNKIAKGENYLGLPYWVMDYPRQMQGKDIFTIRTMVWWGHEASVTLHLQGTFLEDHRHQLKQALEIGATENVFLCVNDSPWEYHFEADNYLPVSEAIPLVNWGALPFVKISQRLPMEEIGQLPTFVEKSVQLYIKLLLAKHG